MDPIHADLLDFLQQEPDSPQAPFSPHSADLDRVFGIAWRSQAEAETGLISLQVRSTEVSAGVTC